MPHLGPCRIMLPAWLQFAEETNTGRLKMEDANGAPADVWALQVNCGPEAFGPLCEEERVQGFPQIALYPRTVLQKAKHQVLNIAFPINIIMMSMMGVDVQMPVEVKKQMAESFAEKARATVRERHLHSNATHHEIFREGCRLRGHLDVPRVPGTIHFEAKSANDRELNYAFTNVSHTFNHLSFGRPGAAADASQRLLGLLPGYGLHAKPLDGRSFTSERFHQGAHHYVKVVHTRLEHEESVRLYLYMHQWNLQTFSRYEAPRAKISYDVSPLEVVASHRRRWYDFATSTLALVGGAFAIIQIVYGVLASLPASPLEGRHGNKVGAL
ncbi:unnamed protein product [Polarella glacialis]|nr:unnamed protein product [Polarella glacialis]